jgi:hypothetical protein
MAWAIDIEDTNKKKYNQLAATTTGALEFHCAFAGAVATWRVQIYDNGSTFEGTFKGKARGAAVATAPYVSVPYQYLGDATAIDKLAGVAVTAAGIYMVRADGLDIEFDVPTTHTGGSGIIVHIDPMLG